MHLQMLTNPELARYAYSQINDLTSTPLELELLRRLEALTDAEHGIVATSEAMDEHDLTDEQAAEILTKVSELDLNASDLSKLGEALILTASNSAELLQTLTEEGYDNAAALKADLQRAEAFSALAIDAGDVFTRLAELTAKTNEDESQPA